MAGKWCWRRVQQRETSPETLQQIQGDRNASIDFFAGILAKAAFSYIWRLLCCFFVVLAVILALLIHKHFLRGLPIILAAFSLYWGLVSGYFWFLSSRLPFPIRLLQRAATGATTDILENIDAFDELVEAVVYSGGSGRLNQYAAIATGLSVVLGAASNFLGALL